MTISVVRARIDAHLKADAMSVLASMGLSVSDAIRLMLTQVVADKALPFPLKASHVFASLKQAWQGLRPCTPRGSLRSSALAALSIVHILIHINHMIYT